MSPTADQAANNRVSKSLIQTAGRLDEPRVDLVEVTPRIASDWLEKHNTHNRRIRQSSVDAYARDMRAGEWKFIGDPIRFGANGTLLDGQHRLWAVVESGVTTRFVVVSDLDPETQETMDSGIPRSPADAFTLRGEANSTILGAVVRRVLRYDAGVRSEGSAITLTKRELTQYLEANPDVRRAVEVAGKSRTAGIPVACSVIGSAYHLCSRLSIADADKFYVDQLINSLDLKLDDPARILLRRLVDEAKAGHKMPPDEAFRYVLLAWNYFRDGRQLTKLQAPKGGWTSKNFPEPR